MVNDYLSQIQVATNYIRKHIPDFKAQISVVLGSGLQAFGDFLQNTKVISFKEIPNFPFVSIKGHHGKLIYGQIKNKNIVIIQGRVHIYEGWSAREVTFYVRILQKLGVKDFILTNAAGGINTDYCSGDFVIIRDLINLTSQNPLIGKNYSDLGEKMFPDMTQTFDKSLSKLLETCCWIQKVSVHRGVYVGVLGPSYETPSEVQYYKMIGGDLVGMSTVLEVIAANHGGMHVACLSLITNQASGLQKNITHEEVLKMGKQRSLDFIQILQNFFKYYFQRINKKI